MEFWSVILYNTNGYYNTVCMFCAFLLPLGTEAGIILECHFTEFSLCLINPVRVAQVLYSERCINEETLDKMETLEDTLDEKKTILLIALHTAISSDHKKLKALATVLSQFEEAKRLSERIISEYGKNHVHYYVVQLIDVFSSKVSE